MQNEKPIEQEVNEMLAEKSDAEIKEAFLEAYRKLTKEYGCDFIQPQLPPPQIVRISFTKPQ